jgi:translation initiation factor 1
VKNEINDKGICSKCGFPKELCVCESLDAGEQHIVIKNSRRKWGKVVTMIEFQGEFDLDLSELLTKAKKKCASGGTIRNNSLELRGDHRFKLKKFLIKQGYPADNIVIEH